MASMQLEDEINNIQFMSDDDIIIQIELLIKGERRGLAPGDVIMLLSHYKYESFYRSVDDLSFEELICNIRNLEFYHEDMVTGENNIYDFCGIRMSVLQCERLLEKCKTALDFKFSLCSDDDFDEPKIFVKQRLSKK